MQPEKWQREVSSLIQSKVLLGRSEQAEHKRVRGTQKSNSQQCAIGGGQKHCRGAAQPKVVGSLGELVSLFSLLHPVSLGGKLLLWFLSTFTQKRAVEIERGGRLLTAKQNKASYIPTADVFTLFIFHIQSWWAHLTLLTHQMLARY